VLIRYRLISVAVVGLEAVLALLCTAMWMRSYKVGDYFEWRTITQGPQNHGWSTKELSCARGIIKFTDRYSLAAGPPDAGSNSIFYDGRVGFIRTRVTRPRPERHIDGPPRARSWLGFSWERSEQYDYVTRPTVGTILDRRMGHWMIGVPLWFVDLLLLSLFLYGLIRRLKSKAVESNEAIISSTPTLSAFPVIGEEIRNGHESRRAKR
jgi:hypothetical protein